MVYSPTVWVDDAAPPINAANLNKIEQGILAVDTKPTGVNRSIQSISSNTSASGTAMTDYFYICTAALTLTMPTAVGNTNMYTVKRSGTGNVTVATTASQTIDGASTFLLDVQYMSLDLISDGANWVVV